jgi:Sulfotransferase family
MKPQKMPRTRRAFTLSAMTLVVAYVISHLEESYSTVRATRSMSTTTTMYTNSTVKIPSTEFTQPVPSAQVDWIPRWQRRGESLARSFWNVHPNNPHWWCTQDTYDKSCRDDDHRLCRPKGLLYVKVPKSGSTTISKIVKRIVDAVAQRSHLPHQCQHREDHVVGAGQWYGNRDVPQSFLMASVRQPADRAMSRFFWSYVTRHSTSGNNGTEAEDVTDEFIQSYLDTSNSVASGCTSKGQGGYQLNYVSLSKIPEWSAWSPDSPTEVLNPNKVEDLVKQTMLDYDFMILNERMEESLVLLQFLLGLQTGDIVSLSYNVGGSYRYEHGKCKQLIKSHVSDGMQEYFQSEEWQAKNYGDYLLFAAVNRSLDMTIDQIGRTEFDIALQEFRRLETKVNQICNERVPFPCSSNGTVLFHAEKSIPHDKIAQCIDEVVAKDKGLIWSSN